MADSAGRVNQLARWRTGDVWDVVASPDGTLLASAGGSRDGTVCLWRVSDGQLVHTLGLYARTWPTQALSSHGSTLAVGFAPASDGSTYSVQLWGVPEG